MNKDVYIAGKVDFADKKYLDFYCNLSIELTKLGCNCYVPHIESKDFDFTSEDVSVKIYKKNILALTFSDLALFYIGQASTGTGNEITESINIYTQKKVYYYEKGDMPSHQILGFLSVKNKPIHILSNLGNEGINELISIISGS